MSTPHATHIPADLDLDFTQDVATLLRAGTARAHTETENSTGAAWLARGELDRNEYMRFLIMLWHVYSALETALEEHATHPVLAPTYSPELLARAPALAADIATLRGAPWPSSSPDADMPAAISTYTSRIRAAAASSPQLLLAHAYVRYLGDLSGGQLIRRRVARAYGPGVGTRFYEFGKSDGEEGVAGPTDVRSIKKLFREGMNEGVGEDRACKVAVVAEAITAFELNAALFSSLRAPSSKSSAPFSDIISPSAPQKPATLSLASVLSFMLAMGLAHFALVTGGFLGSDGWVRAREWVGV